MFSGLLPIGSVVLLKDSVKRVMIVGLCQKGGSDPNALWDYAGIIFPEGYLSSDKMFLFNGDQIDRIYALGYQDAEQINFMAKANEALAELRKGE